MGGENDTIKVPNKKVKCLYTLYVCMCVCSHINMVPYLFNLQEKNRVFLISLVFKVI